MPRKPTKQTTKEMKDLFEKIKKHGPKAVGLWREAYGSNQDIMTPDEFFQTLNKPVKSRAAEFFEKLQEEGSKMEVDPASRIIVVNEETGDWKWKPVANAQQLREEIKKSENAPNLLQKLREARIGKFIQKQKSAKDKKTKEGDGFDGSAVGASGSNVSGYEIKQEYTPLLGTPFFKQMYLYDYLLMHSKVFWYKNYSGPAKLILNIIRNFVVGEGFSVSIKDEKAKKAWEEYEERSHIHERLPVWIDEMNMSGELMLEKKATREGVVHVSIDPSTIWEIVTDPENIEDVKYYHQQYPTQYQIFAAKGVPYTKYILRQIPPELVHHIRLNVTSWEKRGRSDLLAALLYLKYFDDYIGFKLQRTKAEAAYFWDVVIKGDASDVQSYLNSTQSIVDVAPGSENVHNEAITRNAIQPSLSHSGSDEVAKWILSYIFMSVGIPTSYAGTLESTSASRASALVASEPVTKMMEERRYKVEWLLQKIWEDVMIAADLDPKTEVEFNFPELIVEDRSKKLEDLVLAKNEQVISHKRMAEIMAKELNVTTYNYEEEQGVIQKEIMSNPTLLDPSTGTFGGQTPPSDGKGVDEGQDLTKDSSSKDTKGNHAFDRSKARNDNTAKL